FDGPARAVRCAQEIVKAVRPLDLEVRAGVHTGEVEMMGDDVGGIAVHIAARVVQHAKASEVLASSTVKDLVAGAGLKFVEQGPGDLQGLPQPLRLFPTLTRMSSRVAPPPLENVHATPRSPVCCRVFAAR